MTHQNAFPAQPVTPEEWNFASQIQTNEHLFIFLSRKSTMAQTVPAEKIPAVEFFLKP